MDEFARLTDADGGRLFIRKSMVAVVGAFRGKTHVVLTNEDVDYQVRETPDQVMREVDGDGSRPAEGNHGKIPKIKTPKILNKEGDKDGVQANDRKPELARGR